MTPEQIWTQLPAAQRDWLAELAPDEDGTEVWAVPEAGDKRSCNALVRQRLARRVDDQLWGCAYALTPLGRDVLRAGKRLARARAQAKRSVAVDECVRWRDQ